MVLGAILAGGALAAPFIMNIGAKTAKGYSRTGDFGRSAIFGVGYGGGTNVGYNLSNTFLTPHFRRSTTSSYRKPAIVEAVAIGLEY